MQYTTVDALFYYKSLDRSSETCYTLFILMKRFYEVSNRAQMFSIN